VQKKIKLWLRASIIFCLVVLPLILIFLPANYFDVGTSICPSKSFLNIDCLGCGITKAIQHLVHFEFQIAWDYNKFSFVVIPFFTYVWVKQVLEYYNYFAKSKY
jgi:hypothetical protein